MPVILFYFFITTMFCAYLVESFTEAAAFHFALPLYVFWSGCAPAARRLSAGGHAGVAAAALLGAAFATAAHARRRDAWARAEAEAEAEAKAEAEAEAVTTTVPTMRPPLEPKRRAPGLYVNPSEAMARRVLRGSQPYLRTRTSSSSSTETTVTDPLRWCTLSNPYCVARPIL